MKMLCIGGGSAMPESVIKGLKGKAGMTTIAPMTDSGGSSGQLVKEFGVLPPGDIRRHLLALSDSPKWKKNVFSLRFGSEDFGPGHRGHNLGNVIMAGMEMEMKDYGMVIDYLHGFLEVDGRCLPATAEKAELCAELKSGEIIKGEAEIDMPSSHDPMLGIGRVFLSPPAKAYPEAARAFYECDMVVVGPGDLYSSLIPCFLPVGMKEAFRKSTARKIFICPAMTKHGETDGFTVADYSREIEKYAGEFDIIVYNTSVPDAKTVRKARKEQPRLCEPVLPGRIGKGSKYVGAGLLNPGDGVSYDPEKISGLILRMR